MIKLTSNSTIVQAFFWCEIAKPRFYWWLDPRDYKMVSTTNLCYLMRSVILHLPFIVLMQVLSVIMPFAAVVAVPCYLYSWSGLSWLWPTIRVLAWIVAACAAFGVSMMLIALLMDFIKRKRDQFMDRINKSPSVHVVKEWASQKKQSICPFVMIERGPND